MIQRIQTFYLILVSALMLSMLFVPFAVFNSETATYTFDATGVVSVGENAEILYATWPVFIIIALTSILPLVTIFLFKRRLLQLRFCIFNGILIFSFYILFFFYWWLLRDDLAVSTTFKATLAMPAVALILDYMAFRRIAQDEILVRSADRIR